MASDRFLCNALQILPADSLTSREIGKTILARKKQAKLEGPSNQCPSCHTFLVPGMCSVRTISKKRIKKRSKRYFIIKTSKVRKKHFLKIHCKMCNHTYLTPCGHSPDKPTGSSHITPTLTPVTRTPTPRRRRSLDLRSLFQQTIPKTPQTPSLEDFLLS